MSGSRPAALLAAVVVAITASSCGSADTPLRIGVLVECSGLFAPTAAGALAGASLPLLERGATKGDSPGEVDDARVGGRRVELVPACTQVTKFSQLVSETRWLVEARGADVVVGPLGTPDGPVLRRLARRYPDVTFLAGPGTAQEVTLKESQPNLFRLTPDGAQIVAGLGTYAFDELGWRRAVVVAEGYTNGWEIAAGFVAEFCALGGEIVERDYQSLFAPDPSAFAKRHARGADGVALLTSALSPVAYLQAYGAAVGSGLERRLVVAGPPFYDQGGALAPPGVDLTGVVIGGFIPLDLDDEAMRSFRAALESAYPELAGSVATQDPTFSSYAAVEAVATALETTDGTVGDRHRDLRRALSSLELDLPYGPVALDENRQAIVRTSLERIRRLGDGRAEVESLQHVDGVEQRFGGLFDAETPSPSWTQPACERGAPPPWAR
jgi:branched-chain amino acid transport system substrate-binding protein